MGNRRSREFMLRQAEAEAERVRAEPRPARDDFYGGGGGRRRLQLIVAPSFETTTVWEVRVVGENRDWQLTHPVVVATEPCLMLVGHEVVPFPSTELAAYFDRATAINLPLRPDLRPYAGVDGTQYELALFGNLYSAWRFQWWTDWPEQWRPLVELAEEMHAVFSAARDPEANANADGSGA